MSVSGIEATGYLAGQISTAILHGSDEETGDIAICSGVDIENNSSITVYKTQDFDPDNPVYKVKTWDKDGNVTERMIDVSKVDPKSCDTAEMYAYTSNLKESGKGSFEDTVLKAAVAKAVKNAEQFRLLEFFNKNELGGYCQGYYADAVQCREFGGIFTL